MKKTLFYGLISGLLVSLFMMTNITMCYRSGNFEGSMLVGYGSMILAFSLIFVGVKNYRDKNQQGGITFGKAFKFGLYITLVASTIYVIAWAINYHLFMPDFMERHCAYAINEINSGGLPAPEKAAEIAKINSMKEMYKNPFVFIIFTYLEILPVGIIMSLAAAGILKRNNLQRPL